MAVRQLIYAPDPIFKAISAPLEKVDAPALALIEDLKDTLAHEQAIGLAAPMIGELKRIIIIEAEVAGGAAPLVMVNPTLTYCSESKREQEEGSLCFPYISAVIERPSDIKVAYLDEQGAKQTLEATGLFATAIQHEMDYLDGKVFLDHLSKMKRDILLKKMQKQMKLHPPHVHGEHCHH